MKFKKFNTINSKEINSVIKVMKTGVLSGFVGEWNKSFYGGNKVKEFEKKLKNKFNVKYAITVNSWTSGLICAVGALDINPGDEIILPTWTMSACSAAILHWNAIPVFADINSDDFCINEKSILKNISSKTKAILAVDINGRSCDLNSLKRIAKKFKLKIISDSAQSPLAKYKNSYAGTSTDIGGISLNCHKHIQTGEGGVIFTNNTKLANRIYMIRNHAEAIARKKKTSQLNNMIGYNFRMGEIEAAIGIEQLKKLNSIVENRVKICNYLTKKLSKINGLILPKIERNFENVFYTYPIVLDDYILKKTSRKKIVKFLRQKGISGLVEGYVNLHLLPAFQKKIAYGRYNFPWKDHKEAKKISYQKGICPVAESLHDKSYIGFAVSNFELKKLNVDFIYKVFKEAWFKFKL